jgi:hypothetical protein
MNWSARGNVLNQYLRKHFNWNDSNCKLYSQLSYTNPLVTAYNLRFGKGSTSKNGGVRKANSFTVGYSIDRQ